MIQPKILVVVPAFNEAHIIRRVVEKTVALYPEMKVLVVNDGSSDETFQEAQASGAFLVSHPFNLGMGGAAQTGFKIAFLENFDIVVLLDGDGQHDPAHIRDVVKPVAAGECELCIGSRFLGGGGRDSTTFLRRIGIRFFSWLLKLLTGQTFTDPTSGLRAFHRKLFEKFIVNYPLDFHSVEAIKRATRFRARVQEVPVQMQKRRGGVSSIGPLTAVYYMVKVTLAVLIDALRKSGEEERPSQAKPCREILIQSQGISEYLSTEKGRLLNKDKTGPALFVIIHP
jgi:glycosyltransferase involved in cell wall biosynthesis